MEMRSASQDRGRRRRQDDGECGAQGAGLERAGNVEPSCRTLGTPNAVLSSIGQTAQMKMTKMDGKPLSLIV